MDQYSSQWQYRPLTTATEIRILTLQPAPDFDQPVCFDVAHHDLIKEPEYEALSYVCGDVTDRADAFIGGNKVPFSITSNLATALRYLRTTKNPRVLWVDAVCISQADLKERSRQVRIMHKIFRQAQRVIAFVGSLSEHDSKILSLNEMLTYHSSRKIQKPTNVLIDLVHPDHAVVLLALSRFIRRAWFSRVWIIQEAVVARDIMFQYGVYLLGWNSVVEGLRFLEDRCQSVIRSASPDICLERATSVIALRHSFQAANNCPKIASVESVEVSRQDVGSPSSRTYACGDLNLHSLVRCGQRFSATDPRDHIFAMLGMAGDQQASLVEIDYAKPVRQVYEDFTRLMISQTSTLEILNQAGFREAFQSTPSWVPDYAQSSPAMPLVDETRTSYCASLNRPAQFQFKGESLKVGGILIDEIVETGPYGRISHQHISHEHLVLTPDRVQRLANKFQIDKRPWLPVDGIAKGDFGSLWPDGIEAIFFGRLIYFWNLSTLMAALLAKGAQDPSVSKRAYLDFIWYTLCYSLPLLTDALKHPIHPEFQDWYRKIITAKEERQWRAIARRANDQHSKECSIAHESILDTVYPRVLTGARRFADISQSLTEEIRQDCYKIFCIIQLSVVKSSLRANADIEIAGRVMAKLPPGMFERTIPGSIPLHFPLGSPEFHEWVFRNVVHIEVSSRVAIVMPRRIYNWLPGVLQNKLDGGNARGRYLREQQQNGKPIKVLSQYNGLVSGEDSSSLKASTTDHDSTQTRSVREDASQEQQAGRYTGQGDHRRQSQPATSTPESPDPQTDIMSFFPGAIRSIKAVLAHALFHREAVAMAMGRRFIRTKHRNRLGWAPISVKKGDLVVLLFGSSVLHILRPLDDREASPAKRSGNQARQYSETNRRTRYRLMGEAYLDGFMTGEALNCGQHGQSSNSLRETTFELV